MENNASFDLFDEDEVQYFAGNKVKFGLVIESGNNSYSDDETENDSEDEDYRPKRGHARIAWHPSGKEENLSIGSVQLADRSLMPGDIVRRLSAGHDSQKGTVRTTEVICQLKILGKTRVICDVNSKELSFIEYWDPDPGFVYLDSWLGRIQKTDDLITFKLPGGARVQADVDQLFTRLADFKDISENRQPDSEFAICKFYPGQKLRGPLKCLKSLTWPNMTNKYNPDKCRSSKSDITMVVEKVDVTAVDVDWMCKGVCSDPALAEAAKPPASVKPPLLQRMVKMDAFESNSFQLGDKCFYQLKTTDAIHSVGGGSRLDSSVMHHVIANNLSRCFPVGSVAFKNLVNTLKFDGLPSSWSVRPPYTMDFLRPRGDHFLIGDLSSHVQDLKNTASAMVVEAMASKLANGNKAVAAAAGSQLSEDIMKSEGNRRSKRKQAKADGAKREKKSKTRKDQEDEIYGSDVQPGDIIPVEIVHTTTIAEIIWQDGSREVAVPSVELVPSPFIEDQVFFPGDYVELLDDEGQVDGRFGLVVSADHVARTCVVKRLIVNEENLMNDLGNEEISVFNLRDHPVHHYRLCSVAIRVNPFTDQEPGTAGIGQVVDLQSDGRVVLCWADHTVSAVEPHNICYLSEEMDNESESSAYDSTTESDSELSTTSTDDSIERGPGKKARGGAHQEPSSEDDCGSSNWETDEEFEFQVDELERRHKKLKFLDRMRPNSLLVVEQKHLLDKCLFNVSCMMKLLGDPEKFDMVIRIAYVNITRLYTEVKRLDRHLESTYFADMSLKQKMQVIRNDQLQIENTGTSKFLHALKMPNELRSIMQLFNELDVPGQSTVGATGAPPPFPANENPLAAIMMRCQALQQTGSLHPGVINTVRRSLEATNAIMNTYLTASVNDIAFKMPEPEQKTLTPEEFGREAYLGDAQKVLENVFNACINSCCMKTVGPAPPQTVQAKATGANKDFSAAAAASPDTPLSDSQPGPSSRDGDSMPTLAKLTIMFKTAVENMQCCGLQCDSQVPVLDLLAAANSGGHDCGGACSQVCGDTTKDKEASPGRGAKEPKQKKRTLKHLFDRPSSSALLAVHLTLNTNLDQFFTHARRWVYLASAFYEGYAQVRADLLTSEYAALLEGLIGQVLVNVAKVENFYLALCCILDRLAGILLDMKDMNIDRLSEQQLTTPEEVIVNAIRLCNNGQDETKPKVDPYIVRVILAETESNWSTASNPTECQAPPLLPVPPIHPPPGEGSKDNCVDTAQANDHALTSTLWEIIHNYLPTETPEQQSDRPRLLADVYQTGLLLPACTASHDGATCDKGATCDEGATCDDGATCDEGATWDGTDDFPMDGLMHMEGMNKEVNVDTTDVDVDVERTDTDIAEEMEGVASQNIPADINPNGFVMCEYCPEDHKYLNSEIVVNKAFITAVRKELKLLQGNLPNGIYVKGYQDRMDLFSVMIHGPEKTPYEGGLFLFDVKLPNVYPTQPPNVQYLAYCSDRLNPNLYHDGKVCVSLLGTWSGKGTEVWTTSSNLLQVLVSIQGLILVTEPYFNEAGFSRHRGSPQAIENSRMYNEMAILKLLQSVVNMLNNPPKAFQQEVYEYYRTNGSRLLDRIRGWLSCTTAVPAVHSETSSTIVNEGVVEPPAQENRATVSTQSSQDRSEPESADSTHTTASEAGTRTTDEAMEVDIGHTELPQGGNVACAEYSGPCSGEQGQKSEACNELPEFPLFPLSKGFSMSVAKVLEKLESVLKFHENA